MNIKRKDLIKQLKGKGYTKKSAEDLIDTFSNAILENLRNGDTVSIYGFGTFDILERKARTCPTPNTGEIVEVPAHYIPRFYPGMQMRRAVKEWEDDVKRGLI